MNIIGMAMSYIVELNEQRKAAKQDGGTPAPYRVISLRRPLFRHCIFIVPIITLSVPPVNMYV